VPSISEIALLLARCPRRCCPAVACAIATTAGNTGTGAI